MKATRLAAWAMVATTVAAMSAAGPAFADDPVDRFRESVTAERIVVDVHVIDNAGNPITGLGVSDFNLRVDGRPVSIESVEWISMGSSTVDAESVIDRAEDRSVDRSMVLPGRLLVLFFQNDYELSRLTGQMRMIREAFAFLKTCAPEDRVAVLSYDSRLKLRQDFTNDREKLHHAIRRTLYADNAPDPPPGPFPSLAASLDFHAARRASLPEHALRIIGQSLAAFPGSKSLLFFGWGIGNFDPLMGLVLDHNYGPARAALVRSHTSVFVLDVTSADFHSMQGGLEAIAGDTGGMYIKTNIFPKFAMNKVARAISGYYLLSFARPPLRRGRHEMAIRLAGHPQVSILARPDYVD